ncbi:MAG: 2-(1,2-epoxy-1,2-dihydrophenyl)acetyl-CoA isomerase PaaG [Hyphomicrobiaceae bacterium]|nr:2-(1,2-epoxy-1,2-dihydrophenyl)acetyl-CoA isomerase PaaG [Hyphomicrobiaceae bacterium]
MEMQEGVARVTLNRPDKLNSFNVEMHEALASALEEIERDAGCRAVLLTGAGRGFCAGQDLSDRHVKPGGPPKDLGLTIDAYYNPLVRRLRALPKPVVVAVNGIAAGAGANLALHGDIVLAARSARFIQAFAKIGLLPDSGGTWLLPRLLGEARGRALAMLTEPLPAEQAEAWGLIWKAVDDDKLMSEAAAIAKSLAAGPTQAFAAIKEAMLQAATSTLDAQLDRERELQRRLGFTPDYQEGVAAFIEKRAPRFTGKT